MTNSSMKVPGNRATAIFSGRPAKNGAPALRGTEGGIPATAYPRLLRIFIGSTVAAALCGLVALAADGSKGLHPAPFLALATLLSIAAACAFLSMLTCVLTAAVVLWWKR